MRDSPQRRENRTAQRTVLLILTLALALLMPATADAQIACGKRDTILATLARDHHEAPVARGLTADGRLIEVIAAEGGSFTVLVSQPAGMSCIVASGLHWQALTPDEIQAQAPGADS